MSCSSFASKTSPAMGAGGSGKGKGRKGAKIKRPEEELQHAREVNAVRASHGKSTKSVASVSRSKARSQAFHDSLPKAVPAASLGNPAVLPPAPPKASPRQPVLLTEGPGAGQPGGEVLPPAQPFQAGGVILKEGPGGRDSQGESSPHGRGAKVRTSPPQAKEDEAAPASSAQAVVPKRSAQGGPIQVPSEEVVSSDSSEARGEALPLSSKERLHAIFAKAKAPVLTQHDKAVLEEEEPNTPWARRVKQRSEASQPEKGHKEDSLRPRAHEGGGLPTLHGKRVVKGVARNNLLALPKTLGFEWHQGSPSGTLLEFLGKGQDRVAFTSQDLVLKLSEQPQQQELTFASLLPGIAAPVFWVEDVEVFLHDDKGGEQSLPMTLLCQKPVVLAADVMEQRGVTFSFKFLCHVGCILTWLWTQNLHLLDLGESNMGMEVSSTAEPYPALRFFDLLSWRRQAKPDAKWHGFHKLAQKMCPMHANWIKTVCSEVTQDAPKVFRRLASECQGYVDRLQQAGVMMDGEISPRQIFLNRG